MKSVPFYTKTSLVVTDYSQAFFCFAKLFSTYARNMCCLRGYKVEIILTPKTVCVLQSRVTQKVFFFTTAFNRRSKKKGKAPWRDDSRSAHLSAVELTCMYVSSAYMKYFTATPRRCALVAEAWTLQPFCPTSHDAAWYKQTPIGLAQR